MDKNKLLANFLNLETIFIKKLMKTVLIELIEYMNKNDIFKNLNYLKSIDLDDKLTELLIKEKQQIATAFDIADTGSYINGTDYYEQTYENK